MQALSDAEAAARGIEIGDGLPADAEEGAILPAIALAQVCSLRPHTLASVTFCRFELGNGPPADAEEAATLKAVALAQV